MSALRELQETAWYGGSRQAEGIGCQSAVSVIISPDQAARSPKYRASSIPGQCRALTQLTVQPPASNSPMSYYVLPILSIRQLDAMLTVKEKC